jgi:hypothetical protein
VSARGKTKADYREAFIVQQKLCVLRAFFATFAVNAAGLSNRKEREELAKVAKGIKAER